MIKFFAKWVLSAVALLLVVNMTSKAGADGWSALLVAALILGLLNAFLKPLIVIVTLPINIMSLGIFTLAINGFMFWVVSKIVQGFYVTSFWGAMWAALLFSVISFLLNLMIGGLKRETRKNNFHTPETKHGRIVEAEVVGEETDGRRKLEEGR
ncbi:MAG: phage holin family protein [Elusimicrobiota bacterium]